MLSQTRMKGPILENDIAFDFITASTKTLINHSYLMRVASVIKRITCLEGIFNSSYKTMVQPKAIMSRTQGRDKNIRETCA